MLSLALTTEKVVDLIRYREARAQQPPPRAETERPTLTPVVPFRTLTAREVLHRERMLAHLAAATRSTAAPSC